MNIKAIKLEPSSNYNAAPQPANKPAFSSSFESSAYPQLASPDPASGPASLLPQKRSSRFMSDMQELKQLIELNAILKTPVARANKVRIVMDNDHHARPTVLAAMPRRRRPADVVSRFTCSIIVQEKQRVGLLRDMDSGLKDKMREYLVALEMNPLELTVLSHTLETAIPTGIGDTENAMVKSEEREEQKERPGRKSGECKLILFAAAALYSKVG